MFISKSSSGHYDDLDQLEFEQNLGPKQIKEYLAIIYKDSGGIDMCQIVLDYILILLGKYLQMMVSHHISKEEPARLTQDFEKFNKLYSSYLDIFKEVTKTVYKPGCRENPKVVQMLSDRAAELVSFFLFKQTIGSL